MEAALQRCKNIVSGVLRSAGEARGEGTVLTTLARLFDTLAQEWRGLHPATALDYSIEQPLDTAAFARLPIVSDVALRQVLFNVLENARDVSPEWIGLSVACAEGQLRVAVRDRGPGFSPDMLAHFGKPYHSSKGRPGGGLGLFLVVNVLRKLGGHAEARNMPGGGATVTLTLPITALAIEGEAP